MRRSRQIRFLILPSALAGAAIFLASLPGFAQPQKAGESAARRMNAPAVMSRPVVFAPPGAGNGAPSASTPQPPPIPTAPQARAVCPIAVAPIFARPAMIAPIVPIARQGPRFAGPSGRVEVAPLPIPAEPAASMFGSAIGGSGLPGLSPKPTVLGPMACDPVSELLGTGSVCMAAYVSWLFAAQDAGFPGTGQALLAAETYGAFGSVWPSLTVPLCQFCVGSLSGPEGPVIPVDPAIVARLLDPLETSRLISAGILPGLAPVQRMEQLRAEMRPGATPTAPSIENSGAPYFFVLRNGTTDLVKRYWLGQDWLLHYVTVTGERKAIPLLQLNVNATASANFERGVTFSLPGWPAPPTSRR